MARTSAVRGRARDGDPAPDGRGVGGRRAARADPGLGRASAPVRDARRRGGAVRRGRGPAVATRASCPAPVMTRNRLIAIGAVAAAGLVAGLLAFFLTRDSNPSVARVKGKALTRDPLGTVVGHVC